MLVRSRFILIAVALATASTVAGAVPEREAQSTDISTRLGVEEHLRTLGVDPADVVIQEGMLNYAGPDCPGSGWSCVAVSGPVVQISAGGLNVFEAEGGSSHENECTVVQTNTTGANNASCSLDTEESGVTQSARITQTNGSGPNNAAINLTASILESQNNVSEASFDQVLAQEAAVFQENGTGSNSASIDEELLMRAEALSVGGGTSLQDSSALVVLEQDSDAGAQAASITQNHNLVSTFSAGTGEVEIEAAGDLQQEQQTRATDRNIVTFANQESNSGVNDLDLVQNQSMRMIVDGIAGTITELQGNEAGGMIGDIQQDSVHGTSHYDADIDKVMIADADADVVIQAEDPNCCDILGLSPGTPTTCTIDILVRILGPDHAQQDSFLRGRAFAETNCDVALALQQWAGKTRMDVTEQRSGTFVDVTIQCDGPECSSGESPPDPAGPSGNLHLALRNKSDDEGFSRSDPQKPYFTDGGLGDVFEIKLEFHNHTANALDEVVLSIPVPPGTSFASCAGCVGGAPQDGVVVFHRGTVQAGKKAVGIFRVRPDATGFFSVLGAFSSMQGGADSNPIRYLIG